MEGILYIAILITILPIPHAAQLLHGGLAGQAEDRNKHRGGLTIGKTQLITEGKAFLHRSLSPLFFNPDKTPRNDVNFEEAIVCAGHHSEDPNLIPMSSVPQPRHFIYTAFVCPIHATGHLNSYREVLASGSQVYCCGSRNWQTCCNRDAFDAENPTPAPTMPKSPALDLSSEDLDGGNRPARTTTEKPKKMPTYMIIIIVACCFGGLLIVLAISVLICCIYKLCCFAMFKPGAGSRSGAVLGGGVAGYGTGGGAYPGGGGGYPGGGGGYAGGGGGYPGGGGGYPGVP